MQPGKHISMPEGITLFDLGIEWYGCAEGIFIIMEDNNLSLDDDPIPGQLVFKRDDVPELTDTNQDIAEYFETEQIEINRGYIAPNEGEGDFDPNDYNENDFLT